MKIDFQGLVDRAMQDPKCAGLRPVVEKELLHYDILFALDHAGLLKDLTFQGGTSLRLCHGSSRFSEDLDFAGGRDFSNASLMRISEVLQDYLGRRYGLEISIKSPRELREMPENRGIIIDKWQVCVTTNPGRADLPRQRIKIEVANIPAYTRDIMPLERNYDFLPDGYQDVLIPVETLDEIMADKLLAFPASTQRIRHRDIWDLRYLSQKGAKPDVDLIRRKIEDYGVADWEAKLDAAVKGIAEVASSQPFRDEMERFISRDAWSRTFAREGFTQSLGRSSRELFETVQRQFEPEMEAPDFEL